MPEEEVKIPKPGEKLEETKSAAPTVPPAPAAPAAPPTELLKLPEEWTKFQSEINKRLASFGEQIATMAKPIKCIGPDCPERFTSPEEAMRHVMEKHPRVIEKEVLREVPRVETKTETKEVPKPEVPYDMWIETVKSAFPERPKDEIIAALEKVEEEAKKRWLKA